MNEKFKIRDRRGNNRFFVDNAILRGGWGARIGPYAIAVYNALAMHVDADEQSGYPSIAKIADLTGMSDRQVQRSIARLEGWNIICKEARFTDITRKEQTSNEYTLLSVDEWIPVTSASILNHFPLPPGDSQSPPPVTHSHPPGDSQSPKQDPSDKTQSNNMGASAKNGLDDYFEPKPPIEPTPTQKPLSERIKEKDPALMMSALGVTAISRAAPGEMLIKDSGWNIGNEGIKRCISHFLEATELPVPAKAERGKWLKQAQLHLEEFRADDLPRLYRESWQEYKPQVLAGHLDITHPGALTTKMRAILQRQKIKLSELPPNNKLNSSQLSRYQQLLAEEQASR